MNKERKAQMADAAENIAAMVDQLKGQGFSAEQAVALTCAMLSAPVVYTPFAEMSAAPTSVRH